MIARVVFLQAKPGKKEEGARLWDNEVAPLLQKQKGFYRAFRVEDPDSPEGLVVEFWESNEAEETWRKSKEREELSRKLHATVSELKVNRPFELVKEIERQV
jgi:heme-degrading monooxygenase HmoA